MSATGIIVPNSNRHLVNGDVNCDKGMLGQTLRVASLVDFSLDPTLGTLSGTYGQYYHTYVVDTTGFASPTCIITMPDTATFNLGWRCRIKNIAGASLEIRNFAGTVIGLIRVGFAAELVLAALATWSINYFIPTLAAPAAANSVVTFDAAGYPQVTVMTPGITFGSGQFTAKTVTANKLNTGIYVPLLWDDQVVFDPIYYTNAPLTGAVTINTTGKYDIRAIVGVNLSGGANTSNFTIRIRINAVPVNSYISAASIPTYANNVYETTSVMALTAGDVLDIAAIRIPAGGGNIVAATPNGCWILIKFLG
jgi:hypothetical protein